MLSCFSLLPVPFAFCSILSLVYNELFVVTSHPLKVSSILSHITHLLLVFPPVFLSSVLHTSNPDTHGTPFDLQEGVRADFLFLPDGKRMMQTSLIQYFVHLQVGAPGIWSNVVSAGYTGSGECFSLSAIDFETQRLG